MISLIEFRQFISEITHVPLDDIKIDSSFRDDLGIDSLQMVNLLVELSEKKGIQLHVLARTEDYSTVRSLHNAIAGGHNMETLMDLILKKENLNKIVISTFQNDYTVSDLKKLTNEYIELIGPSTDLTGKRVAILVPNTYAYISLVCAINKLGGTVVPLSSQYREGDLSEILTSASPHMIFTIKKHNGTDFSEYITSWIQESGIDCTLFQAIDGNKWTSSHYQGVEVPKDESSRNFIIFTSGSTGVPKGVVIGQKAMIQSMNVFHKMVHCKASDRLLNIPPQTILYGLAGILCGIQSGFRVAVPDAFDLPKIVEMMKRISVTKISSTPSLLKGMYNLSKHLEPNVFKKVEGCYLAGEMVSEGEVNAFSLMKSTNFYGIYGISEAGGVMSCDLRGKLEWEVNESAKFKTVEGELVIQTDALFTQYYNQPDLTRQALIEDGWLRTGDLVTITSENKVIIKGRKKDMIKKGGQQVIPAEIEKVLTNHPLVIQAAVIGTPHPVFGEQVVAYVVLKDKIEKNVLYQHCAREIARYKVPDHIEIIEEIPTVSGKTDKPTLRKQFNDMQKSINDYGVVIKNGEK